MSVTGAQRLVLDLDQPHGLVGDLRGHRGDAGDDVGLPADLVLREQAAVLDHAAVEHVRHVLVREHGEHARQRARPRHVDADDARVRVVGVAELRVQLPGQVQVGRVAAETGDLLLAVRPDERRRPLLERSQRSPPSRDDPGSVIARAALRGPPASPEARQDLAAVQLQQRVTSRPTWPATIYGVARQTHHSTLCRGPASSMRATSSGVTAGGGASGSVTGVHTSRNQPSMPDGV